MREIIDSFEKHLQGTAWEIVGVTQGVATIDNGDLMLDVGMGINRFIGLDSFIILPSIIGAEAFASIIIKFLEGSKYRVVEGDGTQLDADILQRITAAAREVRRLQLKRLSEDALTQLKALGD